MFSRKHSPSFVPDWTRHAAGSILPGLRHMTIALLLAVLVQPAAAQQAGNLGVGGGEELVDRIVAVVGDSVILQSQVQERMLQLQAQGTSIPENPEERRALQRDLLESLVNEQLVIQAAMEDTTIVVDPQQVDEIVSQDLQQRAQSMGGENALRQALEAQGMTMAGFRETLRTDARRQQLQNQYMAQRQRGAASVTVTEQEMREFFEENRAMLGERPASITIEQVVLQPRAADTARARARAEAERLLDTLRTGDVTFEELAREFSDDPGTREQGGSLGWFRRGQMVPAFEDVVFSLREGQTSGIVETRFGFHIIRVDRIRGAERRARHILVSPEMSDADAASVRVTAQNLRSVLESGASIDSLQAEYSGSGQPDSLTVARERLDQLPPGYQEALEGAEEGEVVGPLEWGPADQLNVAVVVVTDVREGGTFEFEDVRSQIRQRLQQEKVMENLFADLREQTHVEIRM